MKALAYDSELPVGPRLRVAADRGSIGPVAINPLMSGGKDGRVVGEPFHIRESAGMVILAIRR